MYSDLRFILLVFTDFAATILDELFNSALKGMYKFGIIYNECTENTETYQFVLSYLLNVPLQRFQSWQYEIG